MKKYLLLVILLTSCITFISAQCEIQNNSYENWTVTPIVIDSTISEDVNLPDSNFSAIRFLFWLFTGPQVVAETLQNDPVGYVGIEQSTDASDGEFAVKLQSKYADQNEIADLYYFDACTMVPDSFVVDVKHVGDNDTDLFGFFTVFDTTLVTINDDFDNSPYVHASSIDVGSDTDYIRYSFPIVENFPSEVDTFFYVIYAETNDETYFLVDNARFIYNDISSVSDQEILSSVKILQNPVSDKLNLAIEQEINKPVSLSILDINGRVHMSKSFESLNENIDFDVSSFLSGTYFMRITSSDGMSSSKFVKI